MAQRTRTQEETEGSRFRRQIMCDDSAISNARLRALWLGLYEASQHNTLRYLYSVPGLRRMIDAYDYVRDMMRSDPSRVDILFNRFLRSNRINIENLFTSDRFIQANRSCYTEASSRFDPRFESALSKLDTLYAARRRNSLILEQRVPGLSRMLDAYERLQEGLRQDPSRHDELYTRFRREYRSGWQMLSDMSIAKTIERPNRLLLVPTPRER